MNYIKSKYKYLLFLIGVLVIGITIVFANQNDNEVENKIEENIIKNNDTKEEIDIEDVYVDLKGAINNPGVYKVSANSRVIDVINNAGGLLETADTSIINMSKKIKDEMTIIIYTKTEIQKIKERLNKEPTIIEIIKEIEKECNCPDTTNDACINQNNDEQNNDKQNNTDQENNDEINNETNLINVNTASKEELMTLPSIGESKANGIIDYRNKTPFKSIDDIKNVSGIGNSIFEKIKILITI